MELYGEEGILTAPYFGETEGELQYKLICTPALKTEEKEERSSAVYSLAVIKLLSDGETESCFIYDVTREQRQALCLAEALCRGRVTPCCVPEIIDDLLGNIQ